MHFEPAVDQIDGIGMARRNDGVLIHRFSNRMLKRGSEKVFLVFIVVVQQGRVDAGLGGDRLDRDGGVLMLGEELKGYCQKFFAPSRLLSCIDGCWHCDRTSLVHHRSMLSA